MRRNFKSLVMLIAMLMGAILSAPLSNIDNVTGGILTPSMLFMMLYVTFCGINIKDLRVTKSHVYLFLFQLIVSVSIYYALAPFNTVVAQGAMICVMIPVAMASVAMGAMLGGNTVSIATYSIISNFLMALVIPVFFTHIGGEGCSFLQILTKVAPIMVVPPLAAEATKRLLPKVGCWFARNGKISYYLWVCSLSITIARTSTYIRVNIDNIEGGVAVALFISALLICIGQYTIGGYIGKRHGDVVAGELSLGQKNTILAIWITQSYLIPAASLAPISYIIWQNLANSYKLYRHDRAQSLKA